MSLFVVTLSEIVGCSIAIILVLAYFLIILWNNR